MMESSSAPPKCWTGSRTFPHPHREMADTRYRCDILWKHLQDNDRFCAKFPAPTIQRPSYSDVENKQADYNTNP